jgi:SAM-dependent methyltransferase
MRTAFVEPVVLELLRHGTLARSDRVITVCATGAERDLFAPRGSSNVLLTSLEENVGPVALYEWSRQDAQRLEFDDASFDVAFVADGLHHCASPHRALHEMYRVARKGIVVFEARDSSWCGSPCA